MILNVVLILIWYWYDLIKQLLVRFQDKYISFEDMTESLLFLPYSLLLIWSLLSRILISFSIGSMCTASIGWGISGWCRILGLLLSIFIVLLSGGLLRLCSRIQLAFCYFIMEYHSSLYWSQCAWIYHHRFQIVRFLYFILSKCVSAFKAWCFGFDRCAKILVIFIIDFV